MKPGRTAMRAFGYALLAVSFATGAGLALAQSAVPNSVIAGGGGTVSGGPYRLHFTMGEAAAGRISSGSTLSLRASPNGTRCTASGATGNASTSTIG